MIQSLRIRNYAIIDELVLTFSPGLTIITGETGAGKSILLGALGLIMGNRADSKSLYRSDEKCTVEGHFEVGNLKLSSFFEKKDLDFDPHIIIRREMLPSGKSRAFVNDTPVTLDVLKELTAIMVDLHQQFDTLDIHQSEFQMQLIDALAHHRDGELHEYQADYHSYLQNQQLLSKYEREDAEAQKELELLTFQHNELKEAKLTLNLQEELEDELATLEHAEAIKRHAGQLHLALTESELAITNQLQELSNSVQDFTNFHSALRQAHERFQGLIFELEDVSATFEQISDRTDSDPERLSEVQAQLDDLYRLQNKHQVTNIVELMDLQQMLSEKLIGISGATEKIQELRNEIQQQESDLLQRALRIRENRKAALPDFENQVVQRLRMLSMPHARFEVQLLDTNQLGLQGMDECQFLFSANKGTALYPIREVASGGELARLSLVIKSLVASAIPLPTLIFDEIDTGVSGDVALKMGEILRKLSDEHQVVSITHSPQIASKADDHYFVFKKIKEDRTVTNVRKLTEEERVRAIAVMLSSNPPSESALENARELITQRS